MLKTWLTLISDSCGRICLSLGTTTKEIFRKDRLPMEIKKITTFDGDDNRTFDHNTVASCQSLNAVICETLRMLSLLLLIDRIFSQEYLIGAYFAQGFESVFAFEKFHDLTEQARAKSSIGKEQ